MHFRLLILPLAAALVLGLSACNGQPDDRPPSDNLEDQAAWIAGHGIGANMHEQIEYFGERQTELNRDAIVSGFRAGLRGDSLPYTDEEVTLIMQAFQDTLMARDQRFADREGSRAREEGVAFGEQFGQREGSVVTESGLRYRVIDEGQGESPTVNDVVSVHYEGRLVDGSVFDSSRERGQPAMFPLQGVVPGFSEALQLMRPGARYEVVMPPDLAYGNQPPPGSPIPPGATLIFDIELLEVNPSPPQR
jgi:FKBP-type peptidyl-prolyl cis-trans isomerase